MPTRVARVYATRGSRRDIHVWSGGCGEVNATALTLLKPGYELRNRAECCVAIAKLPGGAVTPTIERPARENGARMMDRSGHEFHSGERLYVGRDQAIRSVGPITDLTVAVVSPTLSSGRGGQDNAVVITANGQ
jgi:hypothetical protein